MAIHLIGFAVASAVMLFFWIFRRQSSTPLPPGPRKLPFLGNLLDMPVEHAWLRFSEWGNKYGNLVSVSVFGQLYVIVNSAQTAMELLEKKGHIYSDRPIMQMGGELVGWKDSLILLPYGQRFREQRKMFHQVIGTYKATSKFHYITEGEAHRFLKYLHNKPEDLVKHIRRTAGAIILRISHGYEVKEGNDPFVSIADQALLQFSLSTAPGAFLVDLLPSLKYLPDWFPGAGFKQTAKAWRRTLNDMLEKPYEYVREQMELGTAEPSMLTNLLQSESELSDEQIHNIKWATNATYAGGSDTSVAAIYAFFKAMLLYPEVQKQAQAEIDAVIGDDRLPRAVDRDRLPFINAVILETHRWHTVLPTGVPHLVAKDDVHDGYLIPKGALVITNIWKMSHDPNVYQRPMEFDPTRFIKTEDQNLIHVN